MFSNLIPAILTSGSTATTSDPLSTWLPIIMIGGMFVVLYFFMIRPQKKKEKKEQEMRNNIQIGDELVTIGGIVGMVVSIKEDTLVIETGGDRSKIRIKKAAVATITTIKDM